MNNKIDDFFNNYKIKPTLEQKNAILESLNGESFKIVSYAGTGKTLTLEMIGKVLYEFQNKKGLYLAFNKAMAIEAKSRFSNNVVCLTFHSLAYNEVPDYLSSKVNNKRIFPKDLAARYSIGDSKSIYSKAYLNKLKNCSQEKYKKLRKDGFKRFVSAQFKMQLINDAIRVFCKSGSNQLDKKHFKEVDWLETNDYNDLVSELYPIAIKHWNNLISDNDLNISHDVYMKYWALTKPKIKGFDFIMVDECQDMDGIMSTLLADQVNQIIYVGDYHQQIYGWRGAINTFKNLKLKEIRLTYSFRFGEQIANHSNLLLSILGENTPLLGNKKIQSKVIVDHAASLEVDAIVCRSNKGAFFELIKHSQRFPNRKFSLIADIEEIRYWMNAAEKLINGEQVFHNELSCFSNWAEVLEYCELNKADNEFQYMVKLLEIFNNDFKKIEDILNLSNKNLKDSDCVICTVHKAKGLEWDSVLISNDFELHLMTDKFDGLNKDKSSNEKTVYLENWNALEFPNQIKYFPFGEMIESRQEAKTYLNAKVEKQRYRITELREEEIRILYVALTRAKKEVYTSDLSELFILINKLENNLD